MISPTYKNITPILKAHKIEAKDYIIIPKMFTPHEYNTQIEVGKNDIILPYRLRGAVEIPDYTQLYIEQGYDFLTIQGDNHAIYDFRNAYRIEHQFIDTTYSPSITVAQLVAEAHIPYQSWLKINYDINKNTLFGQHLLFVDYFLLKLKP